MNLSPDNHSIPTGTVTFLFTDIEGSTKLWEAHPQAMQAALARHDALLRQAIDSQNGYVFKTIGDAFCAAFPTAQEALTAALQAQLALISELWPDGVTIKVRMALHTGAAEVRDSDYFGLPLNRVARLLSAGHGGQTLLSLATQELTRDILPPSVSLLALGEHRLRDLNRAETVFQLQHPELLSEFPPLKSLEGFPNNLPQQLTSFIGREREIEQIKGLLEKSRLLTLTGIGGAGKTRLSLQVAADLLEQYSDGIWLVELAPLSDPALVPQEVASALGLSEQSGKTFVQVLTDYLKDKRLLLVLDNCEHLVTACAQLCNALLRVCPTLTILASSREALGIAGEQTYRIPSLSLPDPQATLTIEQVGQYEAVRLFIERATGSKSDFAITNQSAPAVAAVCHRLDGIPLAIELAAARVRSLSVEEINTRLDNRFRLLTGGSKAALPRQQTLRALIDWSYDLLSETEKTLLGRLSVFVGGWTLEAAEGVCADEETPIEAWELLDLLTGLVDKSLAVYEVRPDGSGRYRLLETVRQYASDRLEEAGESDRFQKAHRDWYLTFAEETKPLLVGAGQSVWMPRVETEHDNLRAALEWSVSDSEGASAGLRICVALQRFWWTRGHVSEGRSWTERFLGLTDDSDRSKERGAALNNAGTLAYLQGDFAAARDYSERSLPLLRESGERMELANAFNNLGSVAKRQSDLAMARGYYEESFSIVRELGNRNAAANLLTNLSTVVRSQGDSLTAKSYLEEALVILREVGDRRGIGYALLNLSNVVMDYGDFTTARSYLEESLTLLQENGNRHGVFHALNNLGNVCLNQGDDASAQSAYEGALAVSRETGDRVGIGYSLMNLGGLYANRGDFADARASLRQALTTFIETGDKYLIASAIDNLSFLAAREKEYERAATLSGAAAALREVIRTPMLLCERATHDREVAEMREAMGEAPFSASWESGRVLTLDEAISFAFSEAKETPSSVPR